MSRTTRTEAGTRAYTPPPPRPRISRDFVLSFRRRRAEDALAELCVEQGYRAITIDHVRHRCGCGRLAIYELFDNKADIFVSLLERAFAEVADRVEDACDSAPRNPEARVRAGLEGLLAWVAAEPASAWACFVECFCGPDLCGDLRADAVDRLSERLASAVPNEAPHSALTEELLVGGVTWRLSALLRRGEAARAPDLVPELHDFLLGPYRAGVEARTGAQAVGAGRGTSSG